MEFTVQVEKPSHIVRKLTIKVPAKTVTNRYEKGLAEVQKSARLKGFRPGQAPISVIKQFYGDDVRHRVFHNLIDESFQQAVRQENLRTVGSPKIDAAEEHKTGEGAHDHSIQDGQDLTFIATVEVLPEIEVKGYTGIALSRDAVALSEEDEKKVIDNLVDTHAELIPVSGGLTMPDGSQSSRPVQKRDHVDMNFAGSVVTDQGKVEHPGMKGTRLLEVGSDSLIPGFEDHLVGMRRGETKTFDIKFPEDFYDKELAGKPAEFTVTINEVKEKKLPELNDDFAKQLGYEDLADFKKKVHDYLLKEKTAETDRKLRSDLVQTLIEKNPFDVPIALVESQSRALAQDWAQELKQQGADENSIRDAITQELPNIRKRAESQVRASLILEAVAKKESIEVKAEEFQAEISKIAASMKVEEDKLKEFYAKNPDRSEDMLFRLRQERTLSFLLDKAKIKSKS